MTVTADPLPEVDVFAALRLAAEGAVLIDVREPEEWAEGHIAHARHRPLGRLSLADVPAGPVVMVCRSGNRSGQATRALVAAGRDDVVNMTGGMLAWARAGLPITPAGA
ncbi:rhodanese-like domain-containing protein [Nocardioides fonticola]|uniref:Rhodanese-like domain-containing protein n=1 Tax=Nocardioides fonticola TaxID=450363 RepID=A0ABP7XLX4_9ACTN